MGALTRCMAVHGRKYAVHAHCVFYQVMASWECEQWLFGQVVADLSIRIDDNVALLDPQTVCDASGIAGQSLLLPIQIGSVRKQAMLSRAVKKRKRLALKFAQCMASAIPRDIGRQALRYQMACRHAFSGSFRIAMAPDGSRIGKRERLNSPMMSLDSGLTCWAAPQAILSSHDRGSWRRRVPMLSPRARRALRPLTKVIITLRQWSDDNVIITYYRLL